MDGMDRPFATLSETILVKIIVHLWNCIIIIFLGI